MKLQKIVTKDDSVNRMQQGIASVLDFIQLSPLVGSLSLVEVSLTTSEVQVEHKLGRKLLGWLVVDKDAHKDICSVGSPTNFLITLKATGAVNCKILFF